MTLHDKIGQMVGLAFGGTTYNEQLKTQIEDIKAGLIIFFKDNCDNPRQVFELNKMINKRARATNTIPPFIALDQEGGMVARVTEGITQSPGAMPIGATQNPKNAYHLAYNMGVELRELGFNFNFAPVGDIQNNPQNPVINVRSYSEKPEVVCEYVKEAVLGYTDANMMTSIKHFPGHGDTAVDSHVGLPKVDFDEKRLYDVELKPFLMAKELNLPGIMAAHVMFTKYDAKYPTTLSKVVVGDLLRKQIGYNGLVVTDSLTMAAVFQNFTLEEIVYNSISSGCDILLLCGGRNIEMQKEFAEIGVRLVEEGKIPMEVIDRAVERILKAKEMFKVGQMPDTFDESKFEIKESMEFAESVAKESITKVCDKHHLLPLTKDQKTLIVFPKIKVVTLAENEQSELTSLADFYPYKTDKIYMSLNPDLDEQAELLKIKDNYDRIIYCSYNAVFNPNQADLINSLNPKKTVVVSFRTPYDLDVLNVGTYLCAYEATKLSFKAVSLALTTNVANGKLPITLKERRKKPMKVYVVKDYDAMSKKASEIFIERLQANPYATLGLATGSSPIGTYKYLIKAYEEGKISFENVKTYNLDEYCGIDKNHPQSYYYFMHEQLFNHVNVKEENVHIPSTEGENIAKQCEDYNNALKSVSIDLQLLGIGGNGHIGFNEPNTSFDQETFIVELAEGTRLDNARFFASLDEVPTHAMTMGIKNIMEAKEILMLISGKNKAETVRKLLMDPVDEVFPASILHRHPNVTVIIDEDAYSLMKK